MGSLSGVLFDQGIPAERAWAAPYLLRQRMGHLDPARIARDPEDPTWWKEDYARMRREIGAARQGANSDAAIPQGPR